MVGCIKHEDGTVEFDTNYLGAWFEPQNNEARVRMRDLLNRGFPVIAVFQPGDGTRYRFLLVPPAHTSIVSDAGRAPSLVIGDGDVIHATVLDGLGQGVGAFNRLYGREPESIRHRVNDKMDIPNPCTREALTATILSLWM